MFRGFSLLCTLVCGAFLLVIGFQPATANAQKSKSAQSASAKSGKSSAKPDSKSAKTKTAVKSADKNSRDKSNARTAAKDNAKNKAVADKKSSKDKKSDKTSAKTKSDDKRGKTAAQKEADRRAETERKRLAAIEEHRRREAEAARREAARREADRREQARREAIARARAFEKGLRDETVTNILADDTTGEDLEVRRAAIEGLGERAGSVVVMDAQNGKILSMVNQKWAIGKAVKPCSTIKLVTGAAGINENMINNFGEIQYPAQRSPMNLTDALAYSNNKYFQNIGGAVGYPKMMSYAREMGLGAPTGINLPNESAGKLPEPKSGFALNRMSSHGDDFEVTPLQLAVSVSAITNGGNVVTPQVVRTQNEKVSFQSKTRRKLNLPQTTLQGLMPGMMGAVTYGTARRAADSNLIIGGKTGSCIGQGSWVGLFASVTPIVNPKYAVVVVTRGQKERGKWASAVAGNVYKVLAQRMKGSNQQPLIANGQPIAPPRPKIDAKTAAILSDEERDEESSEDAQGGDFTNGKSAPKHSAKPNVVANQPAANTQNNTREFKPLVKPTTMTVQRPAAQPASDLTTQPKTEQAPAQQQRRPRIVQMKQN